MSCFHATSRWYRSYREGILESPSIVVEKSHRSPVFLAPHVDVAFVVPAPFGTGGYTRTVPFGIVGLATVLLLAKRRAGYPEHHAWLGRTFL
jgi:hypothetical protein